MDCRGYTRHMLQQFLQGESTKYIELSARVSFLRYRYLIKYSLPDLASPQSYIAFRLRSQ